MSKGLPKSWNSRYGRRFVAGEMMHPDGKMRVLVGTEDSRTQDIFHPEELEDVIRLETRNYESYRKTMAKLEEQEAEEKKAEAARKNLHGFEKLHKGVKLQRIFKTLDKQTGLSGKYDSRKGHIERLVKAGWTVKDHPHFKRIFVNPEDQGFYEQKVLTKTGLDYAVFLIESGFGTKKNPRKRSKKNPISTRNKKLALKKVPEVNVGDLLIVQTAGTPLRKVYGEVVHVTRGSGYRKGAHEGAGEFALKTNIGKEFTVRLREGVVTIKGFGGGAERPVKKVQKRKPWSAKKNPCLPCLALNPKKRTKSAVKKKKASIKKKRGAAKKKRTAVKRK
jgi:hypothetical protein